MESGIQMVVFFFFFFFFYNLNLNFYESILLVEKLVSEQIEGILDEKTVCPELAEKRLFTPPMKSCHVGYSMRPHYTLSHKIVAQIKPKSPNRTCSKPLLGENSTSTSTASPLTNGAPPCRCSRRRVVLSRSPHTQMLRFVPISPLLFDQLSPQYLGFEIQMGLGYFLDINLFILVQVLLIYMDFASFFFFLFFFNFPFICIVNGFFSFIIFFFVLCSG